MPGMISYTRAAMERAMKVQEVILRAMARKITWWQAAEIIGVPDRSMRRWRERYEEFGYDGLFDLRFLQCIVTIAGWSSQIVFTCGEPRLWSKSSKAIPKTSTGKACGSSPPCWESSLKPCFASWD